MDAAQGASRADKGHVAVGDKLADCLRNRLDWDQGERVPLVFREGLGRAWGLGHASVPSMSKKQISPCLWVGLAAGEAEVVGTNPGSRPMIWSKMLFNAGNGDADDHLGGLARNDEALGARRDKRRVICNDGRVCDLDAQARGAVGCAHNIANAT